MPKRVCPHMTVSCRFWRLRGEPSALGRQSFFESENFKSTKECMIPRSGSGAAQSFSPLAILVLSQAVRENLRAGSVAWEFRGVLVLVGRRGR